jgi:uncharacterized membrane protein
MIYLFWKLVHVLSVVMFFGNITTGLFWARRAHRSREFRVVALTFESIIRSDRYFTGPGVIGILVGGFAAAIQGKFPILGTGWILWSIILFSISGVVFGVWLVPLQRRIAAFAADTHDSDEAWQTYEQMYIVWERWGAVAMITPAAAIVLMVLKPALPGF